MSETVEAEVPPPEWYRGRAILRALCVFWLFLPIVAVLLQVLSLDAAAIIKDVARLGLAAFLIRMLYEGSIWAFWLVALMIGLTGGQALFAAGGDLSTSFSLLLGCSGALYLASLVLLFLSDSISAYRARPDLDRDLAA